MNFTTKTSKFWAAGLAILVVVLPWAYNGFAWVPLIIVVGGALLAILYYLVQGARGWADYIAYERKFAEELVEIEGLMEFEKPAREWCKGVISDDELRSTVDRLQISGPRLTLLLELVEESEIDLTPEELGKLRDAGILVLDDGNVPRVLRNPAD